MMLKFERASAVSSARFPANHSEHSGWSTRKEIKQLMEEQTTQSSHTSYLRLIQTNTIVDFIHPQNAFQQRKWVDLSWTWGNRHSTEGALCYTEVSVLFWASRAFIPAPFTPLLQLIPIICPSLGHFIQSTLSSITHCDPTQPLVFIEGEVLEHWDWRMTTSSISGFHILISAWILTHFTASGYFMKLSLCLYFLKKRVLFSFGHGGASKNWNRKRTAWLFDLSTNQVACWFLGVWKAGEGKKKKHQKHGG